MAVNEFIFFIEPVGGELELTLIEEKIGGNPAADVQKNRRDGVKLGGGNVKRKDFIKAEKAARRRPGASEPDFIGPHLPIFLIDHNLHTDNVEWRCANPFSVSVEIDLGFSRRQGVNAPQSPFNVPGTNNSLPLPQSSVFDGGLPAGQQNVVKATLKKGNNGPADHIFYKATFSSNGLTLDPDFFCDR